MSVEDLKAIELFLAIVDEKSISGAAKRLNLTAPAATRRLAALEFSLKSRLFNRTTRRVSLTEAGATFFEYAQEILTLSERSQQALKEIGAGASGVLTISAPAPIALGLIVPYIAEFNQRYPNIKIGLQLNDNIVDIVSEGIDVAVRVGHLKDSTLIAKPIMTSDSVVCTSPEYLKQNGTPIHIEELSTHACLTFQGRNKRKFWSFSKGDEEFKIPVSGPFSADSGLALIRAAIDGVGILMLPEWVIAQELKTKKLLPILTDYNVEPKGTPVHAVYPSREYLPEKVKIFIEFLQEKAQL